jgi:hypothetical protein
MNALSFVLSILFRNLMLSCPTVVECSTSFDILEMSVQLLLHFRVRGLPVALAYPDTTFMYGKKKSWTGMVLPMGPALEQVAE